jgi:hypothetical protein
MATITGDTAFGVLSVGGGGRAPPDAMAQAMAASTWWKGISHGHWRPHPVFLPPVILSDDPSYWCAGGGLGAGPRNAPGLARAALLALPESTRQACPRLLMLVADAPLAPHVWRVAEGGVALTPGTWVRRYAALPASAPLGTWVHEMAHLLLDWPDLPNSSCLMGSGAQHGGGNDPSPPGANLRFRAGWMREVPATAELRTGDLDTNDIATLTWGSRRIGFSRTAQGIAWDDLDALGGPSSVISVTDWKISLLAHVSRRSELRHPGHEVAVGKKYVREVNGAALASRNRLRQRDVQREHLMRKPSSKAQSPGNKKEKKGVTESPASSGSNTADPRTTTDIKASHPPYRGLRRRPLTKQM